MFDIYPGKLLYPRLAWTPCHGVFGPQKTYLKDLLSRYDWKTGAFTGFFKSPATVLSDRRNGKIDAALWAENNHSKNSSIWTARVIFVNEKKTQIQTTDPHMDVSKNRGTSKSCHFNKVFHYKPSILGYLYVWKHPYKWSSGTLCLSHWFLGDPPRTTHPPSSSTTTPKGTRRSSKMDVKSCKGGTFAMFGGWKKGTQHERGSNHPKNHWTLL